MTRLHRTARSALLALVGLSAAGLPWTLFPEAVAWADVAPGPFTKPPPIPADPGGFLGVSGGEALIIGLICCILGGGLAALVVAGLFIRRRSGRTGQG